MNVAINSQTQSPLVRVLQGVPAQAESFTHHITDNIPPVSKDKLVLTAYNSPTKVFGSEFKFKIPEYGYLTKCYLKITSSQAGNAWVTSVPPTHFAGSVVKLAKLQTHNKDIQTLYGDEILARVSRMPADIREGFNTAMTGVYTANHLSTPNLIFAQDNNVNMVRYLPLPFACTTSPHVNFSTRFVEDLEVHVETNTLASLFSTVPDTQLLDIELVCLFHNFHDTTEQAIRNENYQEGEPASVLLYDTYEESPVTITSGTLTATVPLKSNNLAYGITLVAYKSGDGLQWNSTSSRFSKVELWTTSQRYVFGSTLETHFMDTSDYILSSRTERRLSHDTGNASLLPYYLQFGLQHNELINTGCVGLQTVNSPELRLTLPVTAGFDVTVKVYVHYHALVRIDSGSGVITRTIDQ